MVPFPSSYISSSESMAARRYIIIILLTGLIPILILFGMNLLVDPYNELGIRLVPYPLVETSRTEKVGLLQRSKVRPELIIFGSSRAMELNPNRFPVSAFNFAVNSALPEDLLAQVFWLEEYQLLPRKALVMVDFYVFNGTVHTDARLESSRFLYNRIADLPDVQELSRGAVRPEVITPFWVKYISRQMAGDAWKAVKINFRGDKRSVGFMNDGLLVRVRDLEQRERSGWSFDEQVKIASYSTEKYTGYEDLSAARIRVLEQAFDIMHRHGVELVLGLTPFHPALQRYIQDEPVLARRLVEVKSLLQRLAGRYSAPFLDYSDIRSFHCTPGQMWDVIHLMPECADLLVKDVITSTSLQATMLYHGQAKP